MDLIGLILLMLLHLSSPAQSLKSTPTVSGIPDPPSAQSVTGDTGPELDPNGRT